MMTRNIRRAVSVYLVLLVSVVARADESRMAAVKLTPEEKGVGYVESMVEVIARDAAAPRPAVSESAPKHGAWYVPSRRATYRTHSGLHNVVNKEGDTRMGIAFRDVVDVSGAYFAGQAGWGVWAKGIRVVGYRGGAEVGATAWSDGLQADPVWMEFGLKEVDRIVIEAKPAMNGAGFYAMDDLTYRPSRQGLGGAEGEDVASVVVTFDDVEFNTRLTGSDYAGLVWEMGTGDFSAQDSIPPPAVPPGFVEDDGPAVDEGPQSAGGLGTPPISVLDFEGIRRGQSGSSSNPPDTHGSPGIDHFVEVVNRVIAVYDKETGEELSSVNLGSFLPGSSGDPRVVFDHHTNRWVVIVSDFSSRIYYAVSRTSDPMGAWFKSSFSTAQWGWPDFPTLGVDANGIYIEAYTVTSGNMAIFALEKAPLVADPPSVGEISVFPGLPWEGGMQPCHTYGITPGAYIISRRDSTALRLRRVDPPMTDPTLVTVGNITIPNHLSPPDVPALGTTTPLDTVGSRIVNAVYRDGSIWCAHTISVGGRAACRWYEVNPFNLSLIQSGTVSDPEMHYFYPTIAVNKFGGVAMGFSGASPSVYAGCYYTGRLATDSEGQMADPVLLKAGSAGINLIDNFGRNRWGDYSYTSLDPVDEHSIWTVQEYVRTTNNWGTWVAQLLTQDDCNVNELADACELSCGAFNGDCHVAGCGVAVDCNSNSFPDECDIASSSSLDLNADGIPDECSIPGDADGDVDVDMSDFAAFVECAVSDGGGGQIECGAFDLTGDGVIDLIDFGRFQSRFTGDCGLTITGGPESVTTCLGGSVEFTASAKADALSFVWYHDGASIPGASSSPLVIDPITPEDVGGYTAYALSGCGVGTAGSALLSVYDPATIVVEPEDVSVCPGLGAEFNVIAAGIPPFTYQWRKDGADIEDATENSYEIAVTTPGDSGVYECIVSDGCSQPTPTRSAVLQVLPTVSFTTNPESAELCVGDLLFLTAEATGLPDFQWFKDGEAIPGATELFYFVGAVEAGDAGGYTVFGENGCNSAMSEVATVSVNVCP